MRAISRLACTFFFITISCSISLAQTVWTYDFGIATGSHTSGESTSFLPDPQADGGSDRVRIGSSGGEIELLNPGSPDLGTFSQLVLTAASSTSDNLFQIFSLNGSATFYIKFSVKFSGGNSGTIGFLYGNGTDFGSNSGYVGSSFAGFRSSFQSDGSLLTERRTGSGWSDAFSIDEIFDKSITYAVEIYANNSSISSNYFRNGEEQILNSREWCLWVDGVKFNDFGSVGLEADEIIDGFLFYGQNSTDNVAQIEIDDIVYSNSLPDIRTIDGGEGWRMLSSPMVGLDVEQLARQNLVQGITGSFSSDTPNIYTSHTTAWNVPSGLSMSVNRGQGFIWYLYNNDLIPESKPLPMDLVIAKNQTSGDVTVDLSTTGDGWSLVGNPFSEDLFVDDIGSWSLPSGGSLQSNVVQVWDPVSESYVILNGSNDQAAAFQGFFLQTDTATEISVPESETGSGATFYKEKKNRAIVEFEISSQDGNSGKKFTDRAFKLYFSENSNHGWDQNDVGKLTPFNRNHIGIAFIGVNKRGKTILKAQDSRPIDLAEPIAIPVDFFSSGIEGYAELSITGSFNVPEGMLIEIEDTETGKRQLIDSRTPFSFKFSAGEPEPFKGKSQAEAALAGFSQTTNPTNLRRFFMHIYPNHEIYEGSQVPAEFVLNQNYPNPFNPVTTISYSLPEPSDVQLTVYDLLGRQISELVNSSVNAGNHSVTFDASDLSSGIYIYRLTANEFVHTRKLTVVK